jgi:regulator of protease activity HflC (stomatin/prohibitin superfamily)
MKHGTLTKLYYAVCVHSTGSVGVIEQLGKFQVLASVMVIREGNSVYYMVFILTCIISLIIILLQYVAEDPRKILTSLVLLSHSQRTAGPGLHFVCPGIYDIVGRVSMRVQQLNVDTSTKTKDNVTVAVSVAVQFKAMDDKVYDAYYRLTDPAQQIRAYVDDGKYILFLTIFLRI